MMKKRKMFVSVMAIFLAFLTVLGVLLTIIGSAQAVSQSEINALEEKKKGIAEQKASIKADIDSMKSEQATILDKKSKLDTQNELTRQEITLINEQIELYDQLIEDKAIELENAIKEEEAQMERYRTRMRAMEENGSMSYIAVILKAKSFSDLLSRINDISEVMEADKTLEKELIAARENVETVKAEYEATQAEQEIKKEELLTKKAQLEEEIAAATKLIVELDADIAEYEKALAENDAAEAAVQAEIYKMAQELKRQEEEAKKQQQQQNNSGGSSGVVGGTGSYIWPTGNTTVTSPYGNRVHPIFGTVRFHAGIDVNAYSGDAIYAADGGTVAIATYSSSYGNYIMINHGNGNATLYAHLSSMSVSVGSSVTQGQVIGYAGSTGWSTGPHLHFEIRVGGSTVDPLGYYSNYKLA